MTGHRERALSPRIHAIFRRIELPYERDGVDVAPVVALLAVGRAPVAEEPRPIRVGAVPEVLDPPHAGGGGGGRGRAPRGRGPCRGGGGAGRAAAAGARRPPGGGNPGGGGGGGVRAPPGGPPRRPAVPPPRGGGRGGPPPRR